MITKLLVARCSSLLLAVVMAVALAAGTADAGSIARHSSNRYFQDASGKPMFLIGYHGWAAVVDGDYIDSPASIRNMVLDGAPYRMNYMRISVGINRHTGALSPPSWDGETTHVPFAFVGNYADLDQWDPAYWTGIRAQCEFARRYGMNLHICLFDGVDLRPGGSGSYSYRWPNSFWNIDNQARDFFGDIDNDNDGNADENNDFYRTNDFNNNTGLGYYQRRLIQKIIDETSNYDNVFYEIGNELLGSGSTWNAAVISFIKPRTSKAITQNGGTICSNRDGWAQHAANTPAQVKSNVASIVGLGYPAWEDPDGPDLFEGSADDLRRSAWYSFVGGAAGWGGFSSDFWADNYNTTKAGYYSNLARFIQDTGVKFWAMSPQHNLVGNNAENSCLAKAGSEYVAYVLNDLSTTINLSLVSGTAYYRTYDPRTGVWSSQQSVAGGGTRTFTRPSGAEDWVVYVYVTSVYTGKSLTVYPADPITVDGNPSDWNLSAFTTPVRGGRDGSGDHALIGYDGGTLYYGNHDSTRVLPTSAADHSARVYSRHDQTYLYYLVRCDDSDMRYSSGVDSNWANDCVEFYIDPSHNHGSGTMSNSTSDIQLVIDCNNQKNVYMTTGGYKTQVLGAVTSAAVRDATGWWLEVRILKSALDPDAPADGTIGVDFCFRDNDNNNDAALTTVYSWSEFGTAGFPAKVPDHWGDAVLASLADTTPPAPLTAFTAVSGNGRSYLSWTNPTDSDFAGVKVLAKTTGYPSSPTDGSVVYSGIGANATHTGLTNGQTYYYAAYACDEVPNYSTAAQANAAPIHFCPRQAKLRANNAPVTLTVGVVSAVGADWFYAQCPDTDCGPCGIRLQKTGHGLAVGQACEALGTVLTDNATGEKYISATWVHGGAVAPVSPLAMASKQLGGVDWNHVLSTGVGQQGVVDGTGPNNIGLLIRVCGVVTQRDTSGLSYLYIDDGSRLSDSTQTAGVANLGVRVFASPIAYPSGAFVVVTGISSCFLDSADNARRLVIPTADGMQVIPH